MKRVKQIIGIVLGGIMMFSLFGCRNVENIKGQNLTYYRECLAGGSLGSTSYTELQVINGEVYLIVGEAETYADDATITEYIVDSAILTDMDAVVRKYKMNRWNNKEFSNVFVADGSTRSYTFRYDGGARVMFSSQVYPEKYRKKLAEFQTILDKYMETAVLQPGLVKNGWTDEEGQDLDDQDSGDQDISLQVYEYSGLNLCYRVSNETSEDVEVAGNVKLTNNEDDTILYDETLEGERTACAYTPYEDYIEISDRLAPGTYTFQVGEWSTTFEIQ